MLQLMQRAAATAAMLRALTTTTFDEVSSLKICLPTGKVLQQASVCLSVCLSVHLSPRVHIQSMAGLWRVVRPNRAADFSGPPPFSLGGGKKLRVAKIFYSFALKSLKLLRPDVIS